MTSKGLSNSVILWHCITDMHMAKQGISMQLILSPLCFLNTHVHQLPKGGLIYKCTVFV